MWKVLARGFRESIERRCPRTNVYSQSSQDATGNSSDQNKVAIRQNKCCVSPNFLVFFHGYKNNSQKLGTKDKENDNKYDPKYTWTDAVGLSSILAVGYVVCQSLCVRRKLFEIDNKSFEKWRAILINSSIPTSRLFENTFAIPPNFERQILPVSSLEQQTSDQELVSEQAYGPLTAEETYKEAEDELMETHRSVMSELELKSGILALEDERFEDAIEHFTEGAKLSSASSIFNLALCYELGLGTTIDYEKAAELYKDAADQGHVDAMYNLGVFHAQGKGGLMTNLNVARQLFSAAAERGHVQASEALELEKSYRCQPRVQENLTESSKTRLEVETLGPRVQNYTVLNLMNHNIFPDFNNHVLESDQFFNSSVESINPKNPTDIFLSMLGINEQNAMTLMSVGNTGS